MRSATCKWLFFSFANIDPYVYAIGILFVCFFFIFRYRFGADVMDVIASWTKGLCFEISQGCIPNHVDDIKSETVEESDKYLSSWSVLDIGTGNGLLLHELAKLGYTLRFC